jgi:hypothetical protein
MWYISSVYESFVEYPQEKNYSEDLGVDGRIILLHV